MPLPNGRFIQWCRSNQCRQDTTWERFTAKPTKTVPNPLTSEVCLTCRNVIIVTVHRNDRIDALTYWAKENTDD